MFFGLNAHEIIDLLVLENRILTFEPKRQIFWQFNFFFCSVEALGERTTRLHTAIQFLEESKKCSTKKNHGQTMYLLGRYHSIFLVQVGLEILDASKGNHIFFSKHHVAVRPKGGFFSESTIRFSNLPISKKNIPKNYPKLGILNFKFRIVFWILFFWRMGDLKNKSRFLKKGHL